MLCKQPGCQTKPKLVYNKGYCFRHAKRTSDFSVPSLVVSAEVPSLVMQFDQTSFACPEQYNVYDDDGNLVGYVRLRHGLFTVDGPNGARLVHENVEDDGIFSSDAREYWLAVADESIVGAWERVKTITDAETLEIKLDSIEASTEEGTILFGGLDIEDTMSFPRSLERMINSACRIAEQDDIESVVLGETDKTGIRFELRWQEAEDEFEDFRPVLYMFDREGNQKSYYGTHADDLLDIFQSDRRPDTVTIVRAIDASEQESDNES